MLWRFPVNSKGFGQMYTWILSPPDSPPIQAATWGWAESHVLYRRKTAECTCPFTDHNFLNWVSPHWTVRVFLASVILTTAKQTALVTSVHIVSTFFWLFPRLSSRLQPQHCISLNVTVLTSLFSLSSAGSHILASGSVRIPRFMLLESGGLQIAPVSIQDAGSYTCHAANSEGSLDASAMLTVWSEDRGPRGPICY